MSGADENIACHSEQVLQGQALTCWGSVGPAEVFVCVCVGRGGLRLEARPLTGRHTNLSIYKL